MAHDFKKFPELRNSQLDIYYFESPHKQIFEDFEARVIKVIDGDTIRVEREFRDFDFPVRLLGIVAQETTANKGQESLDWLAGQILGKEITVEMDKFDRVGKFGRLLGTIILNGMNINQLSIDTKHAVVFDEIPEPFLPSLENIFKPRFKNAN